MKELKKRVEKLEQMQGVLGYLLGVEGRTIESFLKGTIGDARWLIILSDEQWQRVWEEIIPPVLAEAERRKKRSERQD